jgi:flagellar biogenesis protein FliO
VIKPMSIYFATHFVAAWQMTQPPGAPLDPGQFDSGGTLLWAFLRMVLALVFVLALAYVVVRYVSPRSLPAQGALGGLRPGEGLVHIIQTVPLGQRQYLHAVEAAGRYLLVASSEAGVQLLGEMDAAEAALRLEEAARARPAGGREGQALGGAFAERLAQILGRRR